ncbi:MAG: Omp28-related outer membrane protein [Bacteroidetes bacterium]|nr:Omp28-related outer membrane protein [Bacteroidota bacterium]
MKLKLTILILSLTAIVISCDKVKNPIENPTVGNSNSTVNPYTFYSKNNITKCNFKKVLLEDYTGQQCGNCPPAAVVAHNIGDQYKDTVIAIAVHAGFFSKTNSTFPTSYTTTVGNDWDASSGFGVSSAGNPNGMINRKDYGSGKIKPQGAWQGYVELAKKEIQKVKLELFLNYDGGTRQLSAMAKVKFKATHPNNTKINLVLMEDSIIGPQKDYLQLPDVVPNYVFMHMLRGSLNGSWGVTAKNTPIAVNDSMSVSYDNYAIPSNFKDKDMYLVAFVYDELDKTILQVEKLKIK